MSTPSFELSKWYMDCVSAEGDAVLAYSADLRWRKLAVTYESVLELRGDSPPASRSTLKAHTAPSIDGPVVSWCSPPLGVAARWRSSAPPIRETIYRSPGGSVEWSCVLPAGAAQIDTSGGVLRGHGYVEHLHLAVAPWRLPIASLRWGRISTPVESIVWIEWTGEFQATLAYVDGTRVAALSVDDDRVDLGDGTVVVLDRSRVVRRGPLATTIAASVPAIRRLGPVRLLAIEECKWLSRAKVKRPGCSPHDGWAIHERVTWPTTTGRHPA